jgi:hypothetical protein
VIGASNIYTMGPCSRRVVLLIFSICGVGRKDAPATRRPLPPYRPFLVRTTSKNSNQLACPGRSAYWEVLCEPLLEGHTELRGCDRMSRHASTPKATPAGDPHVHTLGLPSVKEPALRNCPHHFCCTNTRPVGFPKTGDSPAIRCATPGMARQ